MNDLSTTTDGRLSFRKMFFQSSAYIADLDLDRERITNLRRLTVNDGFNVPTSWSADSKAVLFWSRQNDQQPGIFKQFLDTKVAQPLVVGTHEVEVPRLGPDGRSVLYEQLPPDFGPSSTVSIMHVPIDGGPPSPVLTTRWFKSIPPTTSH